jgi:hypothetical protein
VALVILATRMFRRELPRARLGLAAGWALTAVAFAAGYYLWNLWPF